MAAKKKSKKTTRKAKVQRKKVVRKRVSKPALRTKKKLKAKKAAVVPRKKKSIRAEKKAEESLINQTREALRKLLIQKREHIVREAKSEISKYIKGETKQLVDTALDDGDWSIVDLSEDVSFKQLGTHRETLLKIDAALRKLEEGTYGICEDCGEEISRERLKVMPFAVYCRDCQEKIEQLEAIQKTLPI